MSSRARRASHRTVRRKVFRGRAHFRDEGRRDSGADWLAFVHRALRDDIPAETSSHVAAGFVFVQLSSVRGQGTWSSADQEAEGVLRRKGRPTGRRGGSHFRMAGEAEADAKRRDVGGQ